MSTLSEVHIFWIAVAIQAAGAISVVAIRLTERSWSGVLFRRMFFVCLLAVGLATMLALSHGAAAWLPCASTLGLMSVGATVDFGSSRRSPAY